MKAITIILTIILTILICSISSFAGLYGRIEIGNPIDTFITTQDENQTPHTKKYNNIYYTGIWLGYKRFLISSLEGKIYGGTMTISRNNWHEPKGSPFEDIYQIGVSFHFKGFYTKIEHICSHPIINSTTYNPDPGSFSANTTIISIGYEFEIK